MQKIMSLNVFIFVLLLTGLALSDGLSEQAAAVEAIGGNWYSSSGAKVYVGAASDGGITITVGGSGALPGQVGYRDDGSIYFTYRDNSGTPVSGRYDSDNELIYVETNNGSVKRTWRRNK